MLESLNKDILQSFVFEEISDRINLICEDLTDKKLWQFTKNNIDFFLEIKNWVDIIKSENNFTKDTIDAKLIDVAIESLPEEPYNEDSWKIWTSKINNLTGLAGKDLFMPLRKILTGMNNGPELKYLLPLLNKAIILKKFGKL